MAALINLHAEFGAGIVGSSSNVSGMPAVTFSSGATLPSALLLNRTVLSVATSQGLIALNVGSTASAPAIQLDGQSFVSCTTIAFTTGGVNGTGGIRVLYPDGVTLGWIPVLPSGAVTGAQRA